MLNNYRLKIEHIQIWVAIFFLEICSGLFASETPIYLNYLVQKAVAKSPELQMQSRKIEAQKAELEVVCAELYPKMDVEYRIDYIDYSVTGRDPLATVDVGGQEVFVTPFPSSKYRGSLDIVLSQLLYSGERLSATIDLYKNRVEQEQIQYDIDKASVSQLVSEAFWTYRLALTEDTYQIFRLHGFEKKREIAINKQKKGLTSKQDLLQADVNLRNAQEDVSISQKQVVFKKRQLESIVQCDISQVIPSESIRSLQPLKSLWESLKRSNINTDLEEKSLSLAIKSSKYREAIQNSPFFPVVYWQSGLNYFNNDDSNPALAATGLNYGSFYTGLVIKWNLFNGFKDAAQVHKAQIETDIAQIQLAQRISQADIRRQSLEFDVCQAFADAVRTDQDLALARSVFSDQDLAYKKGQISSDDFFDDQDMLLKAKTVNEKALIRVELALSKWSQETGLFDQYLGGIR